jgi:histidinol dehydrogenase
LCLCERKCGCDNPNQSSPRVLRELCGKNHVLMRFISYPSSDFLKLSRISRETPIAIQNAVKGILDQVRIKGDSAVVSLTSKFV